jgi:hypothetical protein
MKRIAYILIPSLLAFASCNEECAECPPSPEALSFTMLNKDSVVDPVYAGFISADSVQLTYQDEGETKRVNCNVSTDDARGQVHFHTTEIGYLCRRGVQDFKLRVNGKDIATKISFRQKTDRDKCCTRYAADAVMIGDSCMYLDELPDYGGMLVEIEL